ncbi:hypothetical protein QZH41_016239, partial [Actinostola sp. cb2023]
KTSKYAKGKDCREKLIQCSDLRADETIRSTALAKNDSKILAKVSRELVAAEGCYHKSCYREYTRPMPEGNTTTTLAPSEDEDSYARLESAAYEMLFKYIRSNVLEQPTLVRLNDLTQMMLGFMRELGAKETKESTKTHMRRKLEAEFGNMLQFEALLGNNRVYVIPQTLSRLQLARDVARLSQEQQSTRDATNIQDIQRVALDLRDAIRSNESEFNWPPQPSQLTQDNINLPDKVRIFLSTLLTGSCTESQEEPNPLKVQRLVNSFGQDMVFGVTAGRQKTPKHILLPYAVKSLTNNVELIQILNRCGHGVAYSQIEELNTALCLQKMAMTPENAVPLPGNIKPYNNTSLAWDNIDRMEETLSGGGTSHRVNGIAIQASYFGPHLPPPNAVPAITKSKQRSVDVVSDHELPIYNAGERYLSSYLSEMTHLGDEHPDVLDYMESGGFAVQIGTDNPFGKIPVDQACEETVNKDTQTPGGTKGFSLKPKAVSKYYLVAEYRSIFMRNLKEMLHLTKSSCQHNDLQKSRISKDEADVKSLLITLDNWISPFGTEQQDLVCLSTGKLATEQIERDLLQAKDIGEKAYRTFSEQRLESNPAKINFHGKMTKAKLKTFSDLNKKMKLRQGTAKEIILKADRALFAQMIVIAETRELSMRSVLSHPLGPLPWALASADGSLKKTNKSTLAKELQKNIPAVESIPEPSACIIDGMAMVQRLKGDHKSFAEVADALMAMFLREGATSNRIDVVFDVYRETSIKNMEREKRGSETGNEFRNIQPDHRVQQWRKFLSNPQNKKQLVVFITDEWQKERFRQRLVRKTLYITAEENCVEILPTGVVTLREDLKSSQEEADTRLLFHASHAARNGYSSIVISSEDTDVFVLCLAFKVFIPSTIYLKCGTQTRTKYINITTVVQVHGSELCKCLLGLHAFTGCDTVSAFSGKGKLSALKMAKSNQAFCELFQQLGIDWQVNNELFLRLQEFTCMLYSSNSGTTSVNELRYRLFCARKGNLESSQLPPCEDTLRKHCDRSNHQAAIWRRSLQGCPHIPSPVGSGWILEDGKLAIDWMSGEPAPKAVLELLSCHCKRTCKSPGCSCLDNGLKCTDLCKLQDCTNRREPELSEDNNSDDEDELDN